MVLLNTYMCYHHSYYFNLIVVNTANNPSEDSRQIIDELANSLQTAVLLAASLERTATNTPWQSDSALLLRRELERAVRAASELRRWAQRTRRIT
jgi:hypothetical protein